MTVSCPARVPSTRTVWKFSMVPTTTDRVFASATNVFVPVPPSMTPLKAPWLNVRTAAVEELAPACAGSEPERTLRQIEEFSLLHGREAGDEYAPRRRRGVPVAATPSGLQARSLRAVTAAVRGVHGPAEGAVHHQRSGR